MTQDRVEAAAEAMFHKLFRLFGRRDRAEAAQIEEEALMALETEPETGREEFAFVPYGPAFDCAEDLKFLP